MKPSKHVALSVLSGTAVAVVRGSFAAGAACAAIGILIDLDHLVDFWVERGFSLSPRKFFDFCYRGTSRKFYDILHGYEFIPLWWAIPAAAGFADLGWGRRVRSAPPRRPVRQPAPASLDLLLHLPRLAPLRVAQDRARASILRQAKADKWNKPLFSRIERRYEFHH